MEFMIIIAAIVGYFFGKFSGTKSGATQILLEIAESINQKIESDSDFHQKFGLKGTHIDLNRFGLSILQSGTVVSAEKSRFIALREHQLSESE